MAINMTHVHAVALPEDGDEVLFTGAGGSGGAARGSGRQAGKKLTASQKAKLKLARKRRAQGGTLTKQHRAVLSRFGTPGEKASVTRANKRAAAVAAPAGKKVAGKRAKPGAGKVVSAGRKATAGKAVGAAAKNAKNAKRRVAKRPRNG